MAYELEARVRATLNRTTGGRVQRMRPPGSHEAVEDLYGQWQALMAHTPAVCDAEPGPVGAGRECSFFVAQHAAVDEAALRVSQPQERQVWRRVVWGGRV